MLRQIDVLKVNERDESFHGALLTANHRLPAETADLLSELLVLGDQFRRGDLVGEAAGRATKQQHKANGKLKMPMKRLRKKWFAG
ncbi:hypothetical protein DSM3645_15520 [Blastopirellula marina DSM 3645]|uniref:Uncharacterized protein n=1 Tax=Blastopirellula marina DSM 3645 TaxID=314230 RepID=A3ZZ69_9BACT|nr:hypothetical protein DSM3645_15520 [Blastopirellula marina DSM 3645]